MQKHTAQKGSIMGLDEKKESGQMLKETLPEAVDGTETPLPEDETSPLLTGEVVVAEKEPREPAERYRIPSSNSPRISMELRIYAGSGSIHKYRARLSWEDMPVPYVETYCDSVRDAKRWVDREGEEHLVKKMKPQDLGKVGRGMLFRLAVKVLPDEDGADFKAYFRDHWQLALALSRKPIESMTAEDFGAAITTAAKAEGATKERDYQYAVRMVNTVLNLCHTYGILHKRIRVMYNNRHRDRFLQAMRNALGHFVIPDETCKELYKTFRCKIKKNGHYLAALLALTMGLGIKEICALKYCDICGFCEAWKDGDEWTVPQSPIWLLKVRRFFRRKEGPDGKTTEVLTMANSPYKYRLIVIPPHMQDVLREYLLDKGEAVRGSAFLIPARRGDGGTKPDGMKKFFERVMADCGLTDRLKREVFLAAKDQIHESEWTTLIPTVAIFQNTLYYKLKEICEFDEHEIRAYLGLPPYATIDRHYWESKDPYALLRMYAKLLSWDLRGPDWEDVAAPGHYRQSGREAQLEIHPPCSYTADAVVTVRGKPGEQVLLEMMALYGINCRYTVEHSSEMPQEE